MTKRKEQSTANKALGFILRRHREELSLVPNTRFQFINDRVEFNLLEENWISEKTLANLENGYNLPSLVTLKKLSVALEVDFFVLIKEIEPYLIENE